MEPTIRQLQYLVTLADTLHFGRAAERCHVSQPALSVQIGQLERAFGIEIFERSGKGVHLTLAGRPLIESARAVLRAADDFVRIASAEQSGFRGALAIGAIPTIAPYLLPVWVPILTAEHPGVVPRLREEKTADLVRRLEEGSLDLGLLAVEAEIGDVATASIARDPFWFIAAPGHPLAQRKRLTERDLDGEELLYLEDGHCLRDQTRSICRRSGASENPDFSASSLSTLIEMVAAGAGVTLLPAAALPTIIDRPLVAIPFGRQGPARTIALAWRRTDPDETRYRALARLLRTHVPDDLTPLRGGS